MQRRPRRVIPRQRNPRAARNPAYQIRPRYQLAPDGEPDGQTEPWVIDSVDVDDDLQWRRPEPAEQPDTDESDEPEADEPSDPEETSYQPEVQESSEAIAEPEPEPESPPTTDVGEADSEPVDAG